MIDREKLVIILDTDISYKCSDSDHAIDIITSEYNLRHKVDTILNANIFLQKISLTGFTVFETVDIYASVVYKLEDEPLVQLSSRNYIIRGNNIHISSKHFSNKCKSALTRAICY